jgi:hypothetical protein
MSKKTNVWKERKNYYTGFPPENPRGPNKKRRYFFEQKTTEQVSTAIHVNANSEEEARALIAKADRTVHAFRNSKVLKRGELKLTPVGKDKK